MILLAFGLGLLAGATIGGYLHARHIYTRQLEAEIPKWVNQGNQTVVIPISQLEEEIHLAIWETEMEDH